MKAFSLLQPYGSLMFVPDGKRFETRSWRTHHRGLIAIHASKKLDNWHRGFAEKHRRILFPDEGHILPIGAIIGVLDIVDMFTTNEAIDAGVIDRPLERKFGDYGPNRYAWQTTNPIKLTFPIPCNGALGLWTVPDHIERQIVEQIHDCWCHVSVEEQPEYDSHRDYFETHVWGCKSGCSRCQVPFDYDHSPRETDDYIKNG